MTLKKPIALLIVLGIVVGAVAASAGTGQNPLIALKYLTETYQANMLAQAESKINATTAETYQAVLQEMQETTQSAIAELGGTEGLGDMRLKRGDIVTLPTGSTALLLAGNASVSYSAGAVVDVTDGQTAATGSTLAVSHRYMAAENTAASLTIASDTAVLSLEGTYTIARSSQTDYNALADALAQMGLLKGTGTAYGSGYDLERSATRAEGLVMFLRLIHEEDAALAYTGACPFVDAPAWCQRYLAYAYAKGYTNGAGTNAAGEKIFATQGTITATEYVTFVLRAMGYSDTAAQPDFVWNQSLAKAKETGLLTQGEVTRLEGNSFLRAQMVYVSYFALDGSMKTGTDTLLGMLKKSGLDAAAADSARALVAVPRF
ncbi:MAG: hypothetical protein LUG13_09630 [Oscillospiraceae bacterium]|nr:hypothetical protein [Oscillospiraceae bacterium]